MASKSSFELLHEKYSKLSKEMRDSIERDVKFLLKENKGKQIFFKEPVFTNLIHDDCFTDCNSIVMRKKDGLVFLVTINAFGSVSEHEEGLDEMDASACYEILLALNEKSYTIE